MRVTSKGQVTIPQDIREKVGLLPAPRSNSWWTAIPSASGRRERARRAATRSWPACAAPQPRG